MGWIRLYSQIRSSQKILFRAQKITAPPLQLPQTFRPIKPPPLNPVKEAFYPLDERSVRPSSSKPMLTVIIFLLKESMEVGSLLRRCLLVLPFWKDAINLMLEGEDEIPMNLPKRFRSQLVLCLLHLQITQIDEGSTCHSGKGGKWL